MTKTAFFSTLYEVNFQTELHEAIRLADLKILLKNAIELFLGFDEFLSFSMRGLTY